MRLWPIMTILLAAVLIGAAAPRPAAPRQAAPVVVPANWKVRPDGEAVDRFYPEAALKAGVGGRARLRCTVTVEGRLIDCVVVDETPAGLGFGEAAIRILATALFNPKTVDGKPVESQSVIPMSFAKPDGPYLPPAPVPAPAQSMACLGLALDDLSAEPNQRARDVASLWYSLASFSALPKGVAGVGDFLSDVEESRERAAGLRDDPGQERQRDLCEGYLQDLRTAWLERAR